MVRVIFLLEVLKKMSPQPPAYAIARYLLSGLGAFFVAAHVGSEAWRYDTAGPPVPYFWPALAACSVVAFVLAVPLTAWYPRAYLSTGAEAVAVALPVAWALKVLPEFTLAYVTACFLHYWIQVADAAGLVRYDANRRGYIVTRSTLYGTMRATTAYLVREAGLPLRVARLVPFAVSTVSTVGMALVGGRSGGESYAFSPDLFAAYALVKAAVFVALPLLEEAILR